jgi:hypothetical protein
MKITPRGGIKVPRKRWDIESFEPGAYVYDDKVAADATMFLNPTCFLLAWS